MPVMARAAIVSGCAIWLVIWRMFATVSRHRSSGEYTAQSGFPGWGCRATEGREAAATRRPVTSYRLALRLVVPMSMPSR